MTTRKSLARRLLIIQAAGYGGLLLLIVGNEVLDIPHAVFGAPATPINWLEAALEGSWVALLGLLSIVLTRRMLQQIKMLEGFLPICSFCKKIRVGKTWQPMEGVISARSEAVFSHGLCPECLVQHYGEYLQPGDLDEEGKGSSGKLD